MDIEKAIRNSVASAEIEGFKVSDEHIELIRKIVSKRCEMCNISLQPVWCIENGKIIVSHMACPNCDGTYVLE